MPPKFERLEDLDKEKDQSVSKADEGVVSPLQKAKDAAEIQRHETERVKAQREAVFAENDIKDTADLKIRLGAVTERESQLGKEKYDWENKKATEQSEIQKLKAEHERRLAELVKREQDLATRTKNVELREKLVKEREDLMNSVERQKLDETEKYNSLVERLRRAFPQIMQLLNDNADILDKVGFQNFADDLWDELTQMRKWAKNDIGKHCNVMVEWLRGEVEDCNQKAVAMSRNKQQYSDLDWNMVVDNLEGIYRLLPEVKPPYLPADER